MKFMHIFKKEDPEIAAKIKAATSIRMDIASRERTRALLSEYVKMHPIRATQTTSEAVPQNRLTNFWSAHAIPAFAMVFVLVVGGGTAAAAEGALPGDILYPIKVHVNEEMRATLATTPKARADWAVNRAERRLEEAATLALAGELDDVRRAEIETNLDAHVTSAGKNRQQLEDEQDVPDALEVRAKIGAVLIARENILDGVRAKTAALIISAMSARSGSQEVRKNGDRGEIEASEMKTKGQRTAAKARIEATKRFLDRSPDQLGASTREQAEIRLKAATEALSSGDTETSEGRAEEASSHFDTALEAATEIEALISVSKDSTHPDSEESGSQDGGDDVDIRL